MPARPVPSTAAVLVPWALSAALLGAATVLGGCSSFPTGLTEGQRCVRSAQCAPNLICNSATGMGICTSDLTGFGMGMVPVGDAGPVDAQIEDAGDDAGPPIDMDAGPPVDSGPEMDAGPGIDAFVPPMPDAFVPPMPDAFVPPTPDAFVPPEPDAFVPPDGGGT